MGSIRLLAQSGKTRIQHTKLKVLKPRAIPITINEIHTTDPTSKIIGLGETVTKHWSYCSTPANFVL